MADGSFPGLVSKDRNVNATANPIYVQLSDGTNAIDVTAGALDVNIDNASIVVTATDLDIRDLTQATDSVAVGDGTDTLAVNADGSINITDNGGSITVDGAVTVSGTVTVTATDLDIRDLVHTQDSVSIGDGTSNIMSVNANGSIDVETPFNVDSVAGATDAVFPAGAIRDDALTTLTPADGDYVNLRTDSTGALWVNIGTVVDLDIRDLDASQDNVAISDGTDTLAINTDGSINVNIVSAAITGEIHNYDVGSAIASDASDNHDYTATGGTFLWRSVIWSGSGSVKAEMQNNAVTFAVGFLTGRQGDTQQLVFDPPVEVANGNVARVIRTNRQGAATDVYSTIIGTQL